MKNATLLTVILASSMAVRADIFKLPAGVTYRAKGVGYDCGTFSTDYQPIPKKFFERQIILQQLVADKELNTFLVEGSFKGEKGENCSFGLFLERSREMKKLLLLHSEILTDGVSSNCEQTKTWLENELSSMNYYASKRGIRFIALEVLNEPNEVCEGSVVRAVFDRR